MAYTKAHSLSLVELTRFLCPRGIMNSVKRTVRDRCASMR